ncbi:uncharacterized protein BJX67DRAFT_370558 [Aspergillus lucknowensis]|uniref:Uncharacterized protein n=1 Tax=Aspergillus lucknowensis TaxID=176173 RepID=A0ABR4LYV1_9EURO
MASGPAPLPNAPSVEIQADVILQPPLSRCGHGPGLLLIRPRAYVTCQSNNTSLDPEPLQKWAEESFAVVQVTLDAQSSGLQSTVSDLVRNAVQVLTELPGCETKDKFGLIVYGSPTDYAPQFEEILRGVAGGFTAAIYFAPWSTPDVPVLLHAPGKYSEQAPTSRTVYSYPDASSPGFILPGHADFDINFGNTAHTRSLTFIKKQLGGPYFDLEKIWDEHTYYEFGDRSVEKTMATMVQEPYVNHVPTITGGIGREFLTKFYRENFIFSNPDDTKLELISRTVGVDRIVDEFIFCMTHDKVVDALIPGVPATGKKLRIPFTSVVNIRGDRLYHEHIAWDQATVLIQLGLLPDYLPFPYPVDGKLPAPGKRFEYRVPAGGVETANKLQDETSVPSNEMIAYTIREAISLRLAQDGYAVCINDIPSSQDEINATVEEIQGQVPEARVIGIGADVASSADVERMVKETVEKLGPLTLMVANAGIAQVKPLLSVTEEDIDQVISVNFKGVFNCYTQAARQMIAQGDPNEAAGVNVYKILGAASIVAHKPFPTLGIYSASKWAVRGLTQAMSMEMAPHKITVNAYGPGIVGTAMWDHIDSGLGELEGRAKGESLRLYSDRYISLGRTSVPEDVAGLVGGFLAGKDSDYVTGQTMLVDGGIIFT